MELLVFGFCAFLRGMDQQPCALVDFSHMLSLLSLQLGFYAQLVLADVVNPHVSFSLNLGLTL